VRVDLALIVCGNRICEVITATLGPLPLVQLPKSKPVTPYWVFTDDTHWPANGTQTVMAASRTQRPETTLADAVAFQPATSAGAEHASPSRRTSHIADRANAASRIRAEETPAGAGGGRRRARRGLWPAGSGPVPMAPGLPRDEARFSSQRLGRNPPSGRPASLGKTPEGHRLVAWRDDFLRHSSPHLSRDGLQPRVRRSTSRS